MMDQILRLYGDSSFSSSVLIINSVGCFREILRKMLTTRTRLQKILYDEFFFPLGKCLFGYFLDPIPCLTDVVPVFWRCQIVRIMFHHCFLFLLVLLRRGEQPQNDKEVVAVVVVS
jgi:hypothetical protein